MLLQCFALGNWLVGSIHWIIFDLGFYRISLVIVKVTFSIDMNVIVMASHKFNQSAGSTRSKNSWNRLEILLLGSMLKIRNACIKTKCQVSDCKCMFTQFRIDSNFEMERASAAVPFVYTYSGMAWCRVGDVCAIGELVDHNGIAWIRAI